MGKFTADHFAGAAIVVIAAARICTSMV